MGTGTTVLMAALFTISLGLGAVVVVAGAREPTDLAAGLADVAFSFVGAVAMLAKLVAGAFRRRGLAPEDGRLLSDSDDDSYEADHDDQSVSDAEKGERRG